MCISPVYIFAYISIRMEMNDEEIKARILKEIEKTKARIEEYKGMTAPQGPDDAIGRLSRMDAINNKSVMEAGQREAETKLQKLEYVLGNVGKPDFGICKQCNNPIPVGRIILRPESIYCVNCAR